MTTLSEAQAIEQQARERFQRDTALHEMEILHDDGLYRHVRFMNPGRSEYYYDLMTWPGNLVVCGDAGDYHFMRIRDMFEFFVGKREEPSINPHYWAEKLQGVTRRDGAQSYSFDAYKARVLQWLADKTEDTEVEEEKTGLRQAVDEQLLAESDYGGPPSEDEAYRRLLDFEHDSIRIYDPTEWDFREYDGRFLWCCWAIVEGIRRYQAAKVSKEVTQSA